MICYRLEIIGGPYDGTLGLSWHDDGEHPLPQRIWLGRCEGHRQCGLPECGARAHVAFWTDEERVQMPSKAIGYEKTDEFALGAHAAAEGATFTRAVARYVISGVELPGRMRESELVGAGEGIAYG